MFSEIWANSYSEKWNNPEFWYDSIAPIDSYGPAQEQEIRRRLGNEAKNLTPEWVGRLSQSGKDCFDAIASKDLKALGQSMNDCMKAWHTLLPDIFEHHTLHIDLLELLGFYQSKYAGAMYSGCGGGYLFVASDEPVPGGFQVKIKVSK